MTRRRAHDSLLASILRGQFRRYRPAAAASCPAPFHSRFLAGAVELMQPSRLLPSTRFIAYQSISFDEHVA